MRIIFQAHAKINWSLNVLGTRSDGYHELDMLMQSLELSDELIFENARWLTLSIDGSVLPVGNRNLVIRAANALNDYMGQRRGANIQLKKCIPVRAGLGGGSTDCAATLVALNQLWNLHLPTETLLEIGLKLGADVPFCILGGLARVRGIGEQVHPVDNPPSVPLVMVTPGGGLSTASVFQTWDEGNYPVVPVDIDALAQALTQNDLAQAQALSFNALERPAIRLMPEIQDLMGHFYSLGARLVRMTGSGSTVFAAFDTDEAARHAARQIPGAIVTRTRG